MEPTFSIVTVLYQSNAVIFDMLKSVAPGIEIILVDNGNIPPDLSRHPVEIKYLRMDKNVGFGRACNYGAKEALGEFILFLNPDAVLRNGFFDALGAAIQTYSDCSAFCAATYTLGELLFPTTTWMERQLSGEHLVKIGTSDLSGDCCVRVAHGGAFAVRRSLFLEMGGFDPNIFLYFEDDDFSWRLLQRHQPIILVSGAKVDHVLGTSTAPSLKLEFLRGYGKESSTVYLRQKYNLPDKPVRAVMKILKRIVLSTLSLNTRRFSHQAGRLAARVNWIRRHERQAQRPSRSDLPDISN